MVDDSEVHESFIWSRTSARSENSDETLQPSSALDELDESTSLSSSPSRTSRAVRTLFGLSKNAAAFEMGSTAAYQRVFKAQAGDEGYVEASHEDDVGNMNLVRVRNAKVPSRNKACALSPAPTKCRDHSLKRESVIHQSHGRRLSFSVEALQKDHAVIVDEFIEQLSLSSFAYSEPDKFSTVRSYDHSHSETIHFHLADPYRCTTNCKMNLTECFTRRYFIDQKLEKSQQTLPGQVTFSTLSP